MAHEQDGREPTEPTDAELICSHIEAAVRKNKQFCIATVQASDATYAAIIDRGREYLSGARPMPDTPAPDEVAQHGRGDMDQDRRFCDWLKAMKLRSANMTLRTHFEEFDTLKAANTALTARVAEAEEERDKYRTEAHRVAVLDIRVAELEAELADAAEHLCCINRIETKRPTPDHNRVVDRIRANFAPGKEPTSE